MIENQGKSSVLPSGAYGITAEKFSDGRSNIQVVEDDHKLRHLIFLPHHGSQSIWDPQQPDKIFSPSLKTTLSAESNHNFFCIVTN